MHHKSIAKMTADGKNYLDEDDNIIPIINNKIDVTRVVWLRNEGMRISVVLNHLLEKNRNNEIVEAIAIPPPQEELNFAVNSSNAASENDNANNMNNSKSININIPTSALSSENSIEISLSSKKLNAQNNAVVSLPISSPVAGSKMDELLLEVAKAEREQAVDFSSCRGYDPNFLGTNIPLPQPKDEIINQIARLKNNKIELKYFKYSVIFNAVTKMPLISAINVEGDAEKRPDDSKRSDNWLRDRRIDPECQLTDKFYAKSNFDKGHMSRFEDANWDESKSEADALRNGIYTCFYTNACPQVVALNRAGGVWGKLEKQILEKGIKKEVGKQSRMTVFNGPIFDDAKDRIFKSVKIPMQYFKIILWLNDDGELKATAFKLTQEPLVDHIQFDEAMRLDAEEALDINKNLDFDEYQCSIKSLSHLTNIDFEQLKQFDTFVPDNDDEEEVLIEDVESLML